LVNKVVIRIFRIVKKVIKHENREKKLQKNSLGMTIFFSSIALVAILAYIPVWIYENINDKDHTKGTSLLIISLIAQAINIIHYIS